MTSEEQHSVTKQPADTCPIIDDILRTLEKVRGYLNKWEEFNEKQLRDACSDIEWHLSGTNEEIEKIRTNASKIREWGEQWKAKAKEYHAELKSVSETA